MLPTMATPVLLIGGRFVLASLFLYAGFLKIAGHQDVSDRMTEVGLAPTSLLLPATILLEIGGGLAVAVGRWGATPAALALAVFTIATNFYFHDFWTMEGEIARLEGSLFIKNVAIVGGLLYVAAAQAKLNAQAA